MSMESFKKAVSYKRTELGMTKAVKVPQSNGNVKNAYKFALLLSKISQKTEEIQQRMDDLDSISKQAKKNGDEEKEKAANKDYADLMSEMFEFNIGNIDRAEEYLTESLKLNGKQKAKLDELSFDDTVDICQDLAMRVMGMDPDKDITKDDKEAEKK